LTENKRKNMGFRQDKNRKEKSYYNNNRINFLIAVIFLLAGIMIYRLIELQVYKHDFYISVASGQHQIFNELEPERGKIYMSSSLPEDEKKYPLAINKDFAFVFAIPEDIEDHDRVAENLYEVFDRARVEKEVEEMLKKEDEEKLKKEIDYLKTLFSGEELDAKIEEVTKNHNILLGSKAYNDARKARREAEIILKKEEVFEKYFKRIKKKNDPYEPIEEKVGEEDLLKLYALAGSSEDLSLSPDQLETRKGKVWIKGSGDEDKEIVLQGLSHNMVLHRYYPEDNIGCHVTGFTGIVDNKKVGNYGLEGFFNTELFGEYGSIRSERSADRDAIIVNNREFNKPVDGSDFILTIDSSIQYHACEKLNQAALKHGADGGTVIITQPETGAILAMCAWPDYDPNNYRDVDDIKVYNNPAIFDQYEPGSVFKAITMAVALDQEKVVPETKYNDEGQIMIQGWHNPIKNSDYSTHGAWGEVNMNDVLEKSLNTGAIFAMRQAGKEVFADYVKSFGFGEKTGIELQTENQGNISHLTKNKIQEIYAATASFGQGITVTPLQMINAFNVLANGGILMKPYLVKEIIHSNNEKEIIKPRQIRRVISNRASLMVSGMLVNVIESGHANLAAVPGYYVGGKTGTAQVASKTAKGYGSETIHTFVGYGPIEDPKFVMLVKLDNPKDVRYAASSAAPLFGEIAKYLMRYYEVPAERK
jgi:cell division protein FtsI/penicillin-binding protein 2